MVREKGGEGEVVVNEKKIMNGEYYGSILLPWCSSVTERDILSAKEHKTLTKDYGFY